MGEALLDRVVTAWRRLVPPRQQTDAFLWNLRLAHRILWVVLAMIGAYVVVDLVFVQPKPPVVRRPSPAIPADGQSAGQPVEGSQKLRPLSEYIGAVMQRNPFTGAIAGIAPPRGKTAKHRLEELAGGLTIVGIDRGPNPVALVEDATQQRTYVVKVGDDINGMHVTQITAEGVVLSYEGEEFTLR